MNSGLAKNDGHRHPRGFTMIEVLIVIAIIGVMVGLLLPAVQSTRERARATSCQSNMLNLHMAIESYHASFDVFPAGTVTDRLPARMFPDGKDHSWLVQVRPLMDGGFAFSERWSPIHSSYHPQNWPLTLMGPPFLACPSSPFMHRSHVVPLSYVGIHDGLAAPIDTNSRGFFVANRFLRRSDIPDGLSYTLQLGEIRVNVAETFFWTAGNQSTLRTTGLPIETKQSGWGTNETRLDEPYSYGLFADPQTISYDMIVEHVAAGTDDQVAIEAAIVDIRMIQSEQRADGPEMFSGMGAEFGMGADFGMAPPGKIPPGFTIPQIEPAASRPRGLGSTHGPMVNAVFADGRVVTINQSIDAKLYSQIGIRDDGLPLSEPLVEIE